MYCSLGFKTLKIMLSIASVCTNHTYIKFVVFYYNFQYKSLIPFSSLFLVNILIDQQKGLSTHQKYERKIRNVTGYMCIDDTNDKPTNNSLHFHWHPIIECRQPCIHTSYKQNLLLFFCCAVWNQQNTALQFSVFAGITYFLVEKSIVSFLWWCAL